jgi:hypothetical protein
LSRSALAPPQPPLRIRRFVSLYRPVQARLGHPQRAKPDAAAAHTRAESLSAASSSVTARSSANCPRTRAAALLTSNRSLNNVIKGSTARLSPRPPRASAVAARTSAS